MKITFEEYQHILRNDLTSFIERSFRQLNSGKHFLLNWHIEVIAEALEHCRQGKTRRLIINLPPRYLKSHCASVAFVAWLLGHDPTAQIICASYGQDLADKHALDTRAVMNSNFYRDLFSTRLSSSQRSVSDFATTMNGFRMATSIGGVLTGRGADYIIIDDPQKPGEVLSDPMRKQANDWYGNTLLSRLNNKETGCIIVVMQRLHEDDFVGHVQESGEWTVLNFPAIAEQEEVHRYKTSFGEYQTTVRRIGEALHPERESLETLELIKKTIGTYDFAGQYQQAPAPAGGGMVKREWFETYDARNKPAKFDLIFQSWDTANKVADLNDFSVCTTWGLKGDRLYLLDVIRRRLEYPELKRLVKSHADQFSAQNIIIEDKQSGTQLIQELQREGLRGVKPYDSPLGKEMRLYTVTSTIESGSVFLPKEAPWLGEYLHELTIFPNGKFDDQADSTSQALDWIKEGFRPYGLIAYCEQLEVQKLKKKEGEVDPYFELWFTRPRG